MPFHDREWDDFRRDCDFFPAYTDYIFGVDTRPEVENEPGLHPHIFDPPLPQLPPQRLYGLPPPQLPIAYHASMLRQDSSMDSLQPTPCPAPRLLPAAGPQEKSPRSHELATDPAYPPIPQHQRMAANNNMEHAWSNGTAELEHGPIHAYAIRHLSQLPAYVHSHLSQLWTCTQILAMQGAPTDQAHMMRYQQAQQYYLTFTQSVPPPGLKWVGLVVEGMLGLCKQGGDPMAVLQSIPPVESTL